jgi:hypothetical protein
MLLLLASIVIAAEPIVTQGTPVQVTNEPQSVVDARLSQANSFLAAETSRMIKAEMETLQNEMQEYNDENFRIFDGRLADFSRNAKQQIIIGGIGAILVANALIGLALIWVFRRYSYEYYQQQLLEAKEKETELLKNDINDLKGFRQMQEQQWNLQQTPQTIGTVYGQEAAGNMSAMNQWQAQPAYNGSWQAPPDNSQAYQYTTQNETQDPMARPWTMQGNQQQ